MNTTKEELIRRGMCPDCQDNLIFNKEDEYYNCECGFVLEESDFDYYCSLAELQDNKEDYHIPDEEENMSALNNLEL